MKLIKTILALLFLIITSSVFAGKRVDPEIIKEFDDLTLNLSYYHTDALSLLDSITELDEVKSNSNYTPYIQCLEGIAAAEIMDFDIALSKLDSALIYFVLSNNAIWEAQCLFQIGSISEQLLLFSEAQKAYEIVTNIDYKNDILGLSYLGIARNLFYNGSEWNDAYKKGLQYLATTKKEELELYAKRTQYWFYPDSSDLPTELNNIANEYIKLGIYSRAAITYKDIAAYYNYCDSLDLAIIFADIALSQSIKEKISSNFLTSSALYVKGESYLHKRQLDSAKLCLKQALISKEKIGFENCNYYTYRLLNRIDTLSGNFKDANYYNEKALLCQRMINKHKSERSAKIASIFSDRDISKKQLSEIRRNLVLIIIICVLIVTFVIVFIFNRINKRKKTIENQNQKLKQDNQKLTQETGRLITDKLKENIGEDIITFQKEIEELFDKKLISEEQLPNDFHKQYISWLLDIEQNIPELPPSLKKYAALAVIGTSNKDIAAIMHVQPNSIRQIIYRIRKTLGIANKDITLKEYLNNRLRNK